MYSCNMCSGTMSSIYGGYLKCDYCGRICSVNGDKIVDVSKDDLYRKAVAMMEENSETMLNNAVEVFDALGAYKDSGEMIYRCTNKISDLRIAFEDKKLEEQRQRELEDINRKKLEYASRRRKNIIVSAISLLLTIVIIIATVSTSIHNHRNELYNAATEDLSRGNYELALEKYDSLGNYMNSAEMKDKCQSMIAERDTVYKKGLQYFKSNQYQEAINELVSIGDYLEAKEYIEKSAENILNQAQSSYDIENYDEAKKIISGIPESSDIYAQATVLENQINKKLEEIRSMQNYSSAVENYEDGDYETAQRLFIDLGEYEDTQVYLDKIGNYYYKLGKKAYDTEDYINCAEYLMKIDTSNEWKQFELALELLNSAKDIYQNTIAQNAVLICRDNDYSAMVDYIDGNQSILLSQDEANEMKAKCKIEKVELKNLDAFEIGHHSVIRDKPEDLLDGKGNQYSWALGWHGWTDAGYAKYLISGKYKTLEGIVTFSKEGFDNNEYGEIYIYGDDALLWSDSNITIDEVPYNITIDITGVNMLKIQLYAHEYTAAGASPHTMFENPVLSE